LHKREGAGSGKWLLESHVVLILDPACLGPQSRKLVILRRIPVRCTILLKGAASLVAWWDATQAAASTNASRLDFDVHRIVAIIFRGVSPDFLKNNFSALRLKTQISCEGAAPWTI
jgi:hypothetical protein